MSEQSIRPPSPPTTSHHASTATLLNAQGCVLLVMAAASFVSVAIVTWSAVENGGSGAGEGDVGQVKLYTASLAEGAFVSLTLVFLAGALAAFVAAAFLRRRKG